MRHGDLTPDPLEESIERVLKDQERFGFEGVDRRIQEKKLEWMAQNWPKTEVDGWAIRDHLHMVEPDGDRG